MSTLELFKKEKSLNEGYTLLDAIDNSIERNVEPLMQFVQNLVNEHDIKLDVFYYPISEKESVLVVNNKDFDYDILEQLCDFCDLHRIILTIDEANEMNMILDDYGFMENSNVNIQEFIVRHPQEYQLTESVMVFGTVDKLSKSVDLTSTNIQSHVYKENWYDEYIKLINSDEYKKRRHKETHGVLINRNAKKTRGASSRVGFAIVGQSKVA